MSSQRVGHPASDSTDTVTPFAADAANSVLHSKIVLFGALAALFVVVAVAISCRPTIPSVTADSTLKCYDRAGMPISCRADMPSVAAANSTLKCYDGAGNYESCVTRAGAPGLRTTRANQPASWTTTAPYQQATTTAPYQQTSSATIAVVQPANWTTSAPAARRGSPPARRRASAICGRHLIPCFFSALRRGVTHMASVAAIAAGARPAREHL